MKIRCVYNDGTTLEFTTDNAENYKNINRSILESVVLFDGDKILDTITFPQGYTFAYRQRSLGKLNSPMTEKYVIMGIVNKNEQILHFVDKDGKIEIIDTPEEFAKYGRINLIPEESI